MMIQVALVDDFAITRKGICVLLQTDPEINVIIEANNGKQLLEELKKKSLQQTPNIIIIDINMPEMDGFTTITALKKDYPDIGCLVFSQLHEEDAVLNMLSCGANGFLHKSSDPLLIIKAVHAIHEDGFYNCRQIRSSAGYNNKPVRNNFGFNGKEPLTKKEVELIRLSASNLTYNQIAALMKLSPKTVQNYRDSLFAKLNISTRSALTLYGVRNGIIPL